MKTGSIFSRILVVAIMLFVTGRSHALYTNYLDGVYYGLTLNYMSLTNLPAPTRAEKAAAAAIRQALKDLSKPSASVAGDYGLFLAAVQHLGPLAQRPDLLAAGSNIFNAFTNEAQAEIIATGDRIAALNSFVSTRRAASNQVAQAQAALDRISSLTDIKLALLVGRQVYAKIVAASRLAAIGEAHPGFAASSVAGTTLQHTERGRTGDIAFLDATNATETEMGGTPDAITYTYTRTGLNTATLVLNEADGMTTVKIHFTSAGGGTFSYRNVDDSGAVESGTGRFTLN